MGPELLLDRPMGANGRGTILRAGDLRWSHPCCCRDIFELAVPVVLCIIELAAVRFARFKLHLHRTRPTCLAACFAGACSQAPDVLKHGAPTSRSGGRFMSGGTEGGGAGYRQNVTFSFVHEFDRDAHPLRTVQPIRRGAQRSREKTGVTCVFTLEDDIFCGGRAPGLPLAQGGGVGMGGKASSKSVRYTIRRSESAQGSPGR